MPDLRGFTDEERPVRARRAGTLGTTTAPKVSDDLQAFLSGDKVNLQKGDRSKVDFGSLGLSPDASEEDIIEAQKLSNAGALIDFDPPIKVGEPTPEFIDNTKVLVNPTSVKNLEVPSTGLEQFDVFFSDTPLGDEVVRPDIEATVPEPTDWEHFFNTIAKAFGHTALMMPKNLNTIISAVGFDGLGVRQEPLLREPDGSLVTMRDASHLAKVTDQLQDISTDQQAAENNARITQEFGDMLDAYLPTQDDNSFWKTSIPNGIGSVLMFALGGGLSKGLGFSSKITAVLIGAGTESQSMYENAIRGGATDTEAWVNYFSGGGLGATEGLFGVGRMFSQLGGKVGKNYIKKLFLAGGEGALEEWAQEVGQTIGSNATVKMTYDFSVDLMDNVEVNGAVGFILGAGTNVGITGVNIMLESGKADGKTLTDDERALLFQALNNFEEIKSRFIIAEGENSPVAGNKMFNSPAREIQAIGDKFKKDKGMVEGLPQKITRINKERAKEISDAYVAMKDSPDDPEVRRSYQALVDETAIQYDALLEGGYSIEMVDENPYNNSQEMINDLINNKRIKIFSTESGFGQKGITDKQRQKSIMLQESNYKDVNGKILLNNDIFRGVHDMFGHAQMGNSFGAIGEENAWNVHSRMYTNVARKAMTTETRGQNSFVNFSGVNDRVNKLRDKARKLRKEGKLQEAKQISDRVVGKTKFAEQKMGFLPDEFTMTEAEIYEDTEQGVRDKQSNIAPQHQVQVYHFSSEGKRGMLTDPDRFGQNSYTGGDRKISPEPRTFFFTDPKDVAKDKQALQRGNLFIGTIDARKIYDLAKNAQKYGFEDGIFSIDRALIEAKKAGWEGVKYNLKDRTIINMNKPVYVERPDAVPSLGEILTGKWDETVREAKERLNNKNYGDRLYDISTIPLVGTRLISDVGIVMADKILNDEGSKGLGTPREFAQRLITEFGTEYPIVRRFAREIFEYTNSIKVVMKSDLFNVATKSLVDDARISIQKHLLAGETGEYIPTGKGAIILGGDIADFEGGQRKHIGIDFPKDQALQHIRAKDGTVMRTVAIQDKRTGEVHFGESTLHFMLAGELEDRGIFSVDDAKNYSQDLQDGDSDFIDGFVDFNNKFYTRRETHKVTGEAGESFSQGIADGGIGKAGADQRARIKKREGNSYPVWATQQGIAKQISESATINGNDTLIFMVYPNAFRSVKDNYAFQEELSFLLAEELEFEDIPKLPNWSEWSEGAVQSVREPYISKVKDAIKKIKGNLEGRESQSKWNLNAIAYKFGIENGINLTGKIKGVAKFKNINQDLRKEGGIDERKAPHKLYDTEIEGFNYTELNEPIDYNFIQSETKGTDVGNQGKIKDMTGDRKELLRNNMMWRNIHQRGQTITKGQSDLVDALILHSEGDHNALNDWLQKHPNSRGEIVDQELHDKWLRDNKRTSEILRADANKKLSDFVKEGQKERTGLAPSQQVTDSKGRVAGHPDFEGGGSGRLSINPFLDPDMWKSLGIVGKVIGRGAKGFTKWASAMVKAVGGWVKPFLRQLYSQVNQIPNIFKPSTKKKLDYNANKDNAVDPVAESQKDSQRQHPKGTLPSKTKGYNIGREHPKLADALLPAVEAMRQEFDIRRRGTISNEDLLEQARRNAESLTENDVWDIKKGDVRNAEDILGLRVYITDKMLKVTDELASLKKGDDVLKIKDFSDQLIEVMRMWQVVRGVATELGRGVQSFNIPMSQEIVDSFINAIKVINDIDPDNKMGGQIIQETMEEMAKLKTKNRSDEMTVLEWVRYIFLNWILQNPLTDLANIGGNVSNLSFHIVANADEFVRERTLLKGIKMGMREGRQNALKVLHGEQEAISKFTEGSTIDIPVAKKRSWKNYFRLLVPTTRLGIEDAFFRAMAKNIETQRMVKKTGRQLGVSPDQVFDAVESIINDPEIAKFERKEYRDLVKYLEQIEDQLVFQQELGTIGKGFSKISRVAFPIIPFVTTPTNILKAGMGASPFGFGKLLKKDLGREEKAQIVRKALAGSAMLAGMGALISQGLIEITGNGSDDAFERDLMEKMGYKPNHIYINTPFGKWGGSYMNINPLNTAFSVIGDMVDKYRFKKFSKDPEADLEWYNKVAQDMSTSLLAIGKSVTEQSYLRGVREMMDAFSGRNPDWFMRMLTGYARVGAISGVQRLTGTEDRSRYVTRGRFNEQLQKNFPLTSNEGLIESVSAFGDQRVSQYERFPFPFTKIIDKTAYTWMEKEGLTLTIPSRTTKLENRQMNRKEYEMFARGVGTIMDETVHKLWQQQTDPELPADKKLSLEKLQDKLDAVYAKARTAVKEQIKEAILKQIKKGLE